MLEEHRERKAAREEQAARHTWQVRHDAYLELIDTARTFRGLPSVDGLLLGQGETVFLRVDGCALVEERRGQGTYVGHSQGFSVPVARVGGRQIRYRVGATKGHFVQGAPTPTAIDTGTTFITSERVVFRGTAQTRECPFAKLLGTSQDPADGSTTFSLSNRSKPVTIHYGPTAAPTFEFRLDLALALFRGTVDELVAGLETDLAAIDAARPGGPEDADPTGGVAPSPGDPTDQATADVPAVPDRPVDGSDHAPSVPHVPAAQQDQAPAPVTAPATAPAPEPPVVSAPAPPSAPPPTTAPAPGWYADPWAVAPLRWWDGTAWSWQTGAPVLPPPPPAPPAHPGT